MNHVFVAHTSLLLEEFQCTGDTMLTHRDRTPERTKILIEAMESLGRVVRINLTLWLILTEHSVTKVHNTIQDLLKSRLKLENFGDIFVIEASDFGGTTSHETIEKVQTICEVRWESHSPTPPPPKVPNPVHKSKRSPVSDEQSRREQIAKENNINPTDAMLWRIPGSYGNGKR